MFRPGELSPRTRNLAAGIIQRAWEWISAVGAVSPDDRAGRRFRHMGHHSMIAFPPGSLFNEHWMSIGDDTLVGPRVSMSVGMWSEELDPDAPPVITIGDRCNIGRDCSLVGRVGITIEDDVTTAPNVYITDHNHSYDDVDVPIARQWPREAAVRIGTGSWIGAGVVVLPGTTIGEHVTVAAGSVVRGDIPDRCVVAGVPGRVVRRWVDGEWDPPLGERDVEPPDDWSVEGYVT